MVVARQVLVAEPAASVVGLQAALLAVVAAGARVHHGQPVFSWHNQAQLASALLSLHPNVVQALDVVDSQQL